MARIRLIWIPLALALLGGCTIGNFDSIYRPIEVEGKAVAVDAKQRGIYSVARAEPTVTETRVQPAEEGASAVKAQTTTVTTVGVTRKIICPEPSPDALSAYATSGGLTGILRSATGTEGPSGQAQAAFALGETAGSIGLRTQSIQLLRDGLFANCLAYMNGAIDQGQFHELMRRSQNFTLGLLAIEQLTGAVKADQAKLSTSSGASTGSDNLDKELAAVEAAQRAVNEAKTAQEKSQEALKTAKEAETTSKTALDTAIKNNANPPAGATAEDKIKLKETLDAAQTAFDSKHSDAVSKQAIANSDDRTVKDANGRLAVANEQLQLAQGRVRAFASGSADFAAAQSRSQVAEHISTAVHKIVTTVLVQSGREEVCNLAVSQALSKPNDPDPAALASVRGFCPMTVQSTVYKALVPNASPDGKARLFQQLIQ